MAGDYAGGVSIDFTDARFKRKIYEGPGPGDHEIPEDLSKLCGKLRTHPGTRRGPPGNLWLTRPPRSIIPSPVAVPSKFDSGFHFNKYGVLVKNPRIKHEPNCFYNVPQGEANQTTILYKGNFWSRMSGRTYKRPSIGPGPLDYDLEVKQSAAQKQDDKIREMKKMTARQPRFLDILQKKVIRENFPAPNSYRLKGHFDKYFKISCKCSPNYVEPPPFGRTAKRFDDKSRIDMPGPTAYDPKLQTKCVVSILPAPFGSYTGRFQQIMQNETPDPARYYTDYGNVAYESQKRFKSNYVQPTTEFGRSRKFENEEDYSDEGDEKQNEIVKYNVHHAAFKSTTDRFPESKIDCPDPCSYDVITAFNKTRGKCNLGGRVEAPFGARGGRFPKIPHNVKLDVLDPTRYNVSRDISENVKGGVIPPPHKESQPFMSPSPTHYHISPFILSSVLKKSFNVTLGQPEAMDGFSKGKKQKTEKNL